MEPVERELAMSLRSVDHASCLNAVARAGSSISEAELVLSASDLLADSAARHASIREQRSRLTAELVTWSSLNYNKEEVSDIRASLRMVTTKEVLMASPIGEELVKYGREEGREEGELIAARQYITLLVESRFPSLIDRDVIDTITDPAVMQELFHALLRATDPAEARAAITRILGSAPE